MNNREVRRAIYSKLTGASSVTTLLPAATNVFHGVAPQGSSQPYIVFSFSGGSDTYTFGDRVFRRQTWLIKAVSHGETHDIADNIDAAIDALLFNGTLTITGGTLLDIRRTSDVSYLEIEDGEQIRHSGGLYQITYA